MTKPEYSSTPENYTPKLVGRKPVRVALIGWIWCVIGSLEIILGLLALQLITSTPVTKIYGYKEIVSYLVSILAIIMAIGIISILIGYGLLKTKNIAWKIAIEISLLYISLGLGFLIIMGQGWLIDLAPLTLINIMRGFAFTGVGAVLLALLLQKSVRQHFGIRYEGRRIVSSISIIAIVAVPTAIGIFAYGYSVGIFTADDNSIDERRLDEIFHFNAGGKEWSVLDDMPTPRDEVVAAVIDERIYLVGGHDHTGTSTTKVEVYDTRSNAWSEVKELPKALDHAGVASYEGKLYVVGGFSSSIPSSNLFIFDPTTDEWTSGKDMPTPRGALTVQFANGILYAVGGLNSDTLTINEAYDPYTNTWTRKAPMPTGRDHLASAVVDGKLYVIGGRQASLQSNQNANEEYDPEKNEWTVKSSMPSYRAALTATSLGDSVYVFCGQNRVRNFQNNEQYVPSLDRWVVRDAMPTPRHSCASATVDGDIYVIGGSLTPGTSVTSKNEVFSPLKWDRVDRDAKP